MVTTDLLLYSQVAVDNKINNQPTSIEVLKNVIQLRDFLNSLEKMLDIKIIVNSGYRCEKVNRLVGGVQNSFHLYGLAADITCENTGKCTLSDLKALCKELRNTRLSEVVVHDNYVHIAIKKYC